MSRLHLHPESHSSSRIGWLRAAVLGANLDFLVAIDEFHCFRRAENVSDERPRFSERSAAGA